MRLLSEELQVIKKGILYRKNVTESVADDFINSLPEKLERGTGDSELIVTKSKYKTIRDKAWETLIMCGADKLPLDLIKVADFFKWGVSTFQEEAQFLAELGQDLTDTLGLTVIHKQSGRAKVLYDRDITPTGRKRFTIAHEFGHIILRHFADMPYLEKEADMYAARLLEPVAILKECKVASAEEVAELCGVSLQAAKIRYKRLQELEDRGMFYLSPLEARLVRNFSLFIDGYKRKMQKE